MSYLASHCVELARLASELDCRACDLMRLLSLLSLASLACWARQPVTQRTELLSRLRGALLLSGAVSTVAVALSATRESREYEELHRRLFAEYIYEDSNVLEIGYGRGANLALYPAVRFALQGLDPSEPRDLSPVPATARLDFRGLVRGTAETLPFPDGSFDAVVGTLVLCTVADPVRSLREVSRVLRPGGRFLFFEHVLGAPGTLLRLQHQLLSPVQEVVADGCHLNRATDEMLRDAVPGLFGHLAELSYLQLDSQWPISRQVCGALIK